MPTILVFDIEVDYDANRLVAGTFARSMHSISLDSLLDFSSSVAELQKLELKVYPNPATDRLMLSMDHEGRDWQYQIFSLDGKEVRSARLEQTLEVDVDDLSDGNYILRVYNKDHSSSIQFSKQALR